MPDYTITIRMKGEDAASSQIKQVSGSIKELGDKSNETTQKTGGLKGVIGQFKSEILGLGTASGLVKFGQFLGDMNELGMRVNASKNTFTALSGGAQQASINLQSMQTATRGVVDNMTLMNGANRLLLMGLASTGQEAASLAGGAVALGKAMGMDAAQSVESFAALLANRSIPRLDNFGISAANVRVRIDELKASGMGIEEAFNAAVIAEMAVSMDKLGASLDTNATAFERWGTRIQNTMQDFGSNVAAGFEAVATGMELITGQDAGHEHLRGVAQEQAAAYVDAFLASYGGQLDASRGEMQTFLERALYTRMTGGDASAGALSSMLIGTDVFAGIVPTQDEMARLEGVLTGIYTIADATGAMEQAQADYAVQSAKTAQAMTYLNEINADHGFTQTASGLMEASDAMEAYREQTAQAADRQRALFEEFDKTIPQQPSQLIEASDAMEAYWEQQGNIQRGAEMFSGIVDGVAFQYGRWTQIGGQAFQTLTNMSQTWQASQASLAGSMQVIDNAFTTMGLDPSAFGGRMMDFQLPAMPEFVSQTTLDNMTSMYQQAQLELQNIQSLAAQGLIPQEEVTKAQNMVSNLGTMVGQLETIQQLSDITGQTGGGILGELGNIVMAQAGTLDTGLADQLQQQIDLASGKETASSVALSEQAAPLILAIAEQVGPEAAAAALQALEQNMEAGKLAGMADEQIAAMIPTWTGYQMGAGGDVQKAMDMSMFANAQGQLQQMSPFGNLLNTIFNPTTDQGAGAEGAMSPTQEMAGMQEQLPIVTGMFEPLTTSAGNYATSLSDAQSSITQSISGVGELQTALDGLGKERVLKVRIVPDDPSGVLALVGAQGNMAQTIRDNGGTVPGRAPQISE